MYVNVLNSTPVLAAHRVSAVNSLDGALISGPSERAVTPSSSNPIQVSPAVAIAKPYPQSSTVDQDMQRQLDEYNRSVTIIIWYKVETEPIRLQHTNSTFPYFQLSQLPSLSKDLGLTSGSYLDTYDSRTGKWEQHTTSTVRLVTTQQRLLYKIRKNLLEGLGDSECTGLEDEVQAQPKTMLLKTEVQGNKRPLKRLSSDTSPPGPSHKVHIPNNHYSAPQNSPTPSSVVGENSLHPQSQLSLKPPSEISGALDTGRSPRVDYTLPPASYTVALPTSSSTAHHPGLPPHLTKPEYTPAPIPLHPHPPLKRWPNDYTVSELTAGFHAMDILIQQPPSGTTMTQRTAFERVFGSRYVKSTVCRHRGVWRKAQGPLRAQFEAMGNDERACWGEFVRRTEGRPSMRVGSQVTNDVPSHPQGNVEPSNDASNMHSGNNQAVPRRSEADSAAIEEPVMASLQKPDNHDESSLLNGRFP